MAEEIKKLEAEVEAARKAAEAAKAKQQAEKARFQSKVEARRQTAKEKVAAKKEATPAATQAPAPAPVPVVKAASAPSPVPSPAPVAAAPAESQQYYDATLLRKKKIPGLDYNNREKYLSPEDFQEIFGMDKESFYQMPKWKQTKAKRANKLF